MKNTFKQAVYLFILFVNLTCSPSTSHAQVSSNSDHPESLFIRTFKGNNWISTATGFIVSYKNNLYLLTNWHVITGKEIDLTPKTVVPDKLGLFFKEDNKQLAQPFPTQTGWIEYRDTVAGQLFDIAAIRLPAKLTMLLPKVNIIDDLSGNLKSDTCYLFGFPKSDSIDTYDFTTQKKIKTSIFNTNGRLIYIDQKTHADLNKYGHFIVHNDQMANGISGAPVYSADMKLIGIYSTGALGSPYGYFWNIESIKNLLDNGTRIDFSKIKD